MASGIIRNFLVQAPTPAFFPLIFQHSPLKEDEGEDKLEDKPEEREEEEREEEEEGYEESEEQEEEEEECLEEAFLNPANYTLDVTKQLLRFADLISRDVQRYFSRSSGDSCDIYSDSISVTTSGRLRYYDDLLRIARAGSPEEQENSSVTSSEDQGVMAVKGNGGLGPLAELFDHRGPREGRGRPMIKRHLPLSFWTEPIPSCSVVSFDTHEVTHTNSDTPSQDSTRTNVNTHIHCNPLSHHSTDTLDSTQPDFSDLLANWDPNPELTHTLTGNTHMQH